MSITIPTQAMVEEIARDRVIKRKIRAMYPMDYYKPHKVQKIIHRDQHHTLIFFGGNRSAKTYTGCAEASMAVQGIHPYYPYRTGTKEKPFKVRFISTPENIQENIQPLLLSLLPTGSVKPGRVHQSGFFKDFRVMPPKYWDRKPFWGYIDFKSVDQDIKRLESVALDLIIPDEPMPHSFYGACVTRIAADCVIPPRMIFPATPLEEANWMAAEFFEGDKPVSGIGYYEISIWDNCMCLESEKHDRGDNLCRCNSGHIHKAVILETLERLKSDPLEYKARVHGKPMFHYRAIFPMFDRNIHVIDGDKMGDWVHGRPRRGVLYITLDPHDARPDFIQFWVIDPYKRLYLIDEFPNFFEGQYAGQPYDKIRDRPLTPNKLAYMIIDRVAKIGLPVGGCGIDPYKGKTAYNPRDSVVKLTVDVINDGLYAVDPNFPSFLTVDPHKDAEGELSAGHRLIRQLLYYDKNKPLGRGNMPGIFWKSTCENSIRSMINYRQEKPTDREGNVPIGKRPEEQYKHAVDNTRYLLAIPPIYWIEDVFAVASEPPDAVSA